jgi:hypothetical protein
MCPSVRLTAPLSHATALSGARSTVTLPLSPKDSIKCPECRAEIPLTEVISHQIEEQLAAQLAREVAAREKEFAAAAAVREEELRREFAEAQERRDAQLRKRAEEKVATELADLGARVEEQDTQIRKARERELDLLQQKRRLDEERAKLDLELARRIDEERQKIALEVRRSAAEEHQLELRQKELQVEQMKRQIKELQESAEQTRAGLLGEAQERELEDVLREKFRADRIEPVKSGVRGADVLQSVYSPRGECCGRILWESKRARNWSNGWIGKLKEDQAAAGADVAVLVCSALPVGVRHMELVDGVWIVGFAYVSAMASALRQGLIGVAQARSIDANRKDALDEIYDYLTSNDFNRRVRAMVESFVEMKSDLESERRSMERMWTKRAKQLDALGLNTAGMYGELEAMIGSALPAIETLELPPPVPLRSAS